MSSFDVHKTPRVDRRSRWLWPLSALALAPASLFAQANDSDDSDEIFELSPFQVEAGSNEGYRATSTMAGSQLSTPLKDVAAAISVVTEEFLQDTASTDLKDILVYQTNSEVAGIGGNFYGTSADDGGYRNEMLVNPQRGTRLRGLNYADITRNYYSSNIPTNSYNTSRVDISRGSNSILFGLGSPAGIINGSTKDAILSEKGGAVEFALSSYGSHREVVDLNIPLIEDKLAVRFVAMNDDEEFRQDFTYEKDRRLFASLRWQPELADGIYTQVDVRAEYGDIDANRPNSVTAADFITNWFGPIGQRLMYDPLWFNGWPQDGPDDYEGRWDLENYFAGAPARNWWDGTPAVIFADPGANVVGNGTLDAYRQRDGDPWGGLSGVTNPNWNEGGWEVWNKDTKAYYSGNAEVTRIINQFESSTGQDFVGFGSGLWPTQMILDGPLAFIDRTIQGPNKSEYNEFDSLELSFIQTYLDGDLGINLGLYKETYESGHMNAVDTNRVSVDVNANLRGGYANPDVGRPFVLGGASGQDNVDEVETFRAKAFYRFDPNEHIQNDLISKLFGEQTFTSVYTDQRFDYFNAGYNLYAWDADTYGLVFDDWKGHSGIWGIHYLGDDLRGIPSFDAIPASAVPGITSVHAPGSTANVLSFDHVDAWDWRTHNSGLLNYRDDKDDLYTWASQGYNTTESLAFVWQGNLLNDAIKPLFGWREDTYNAWDKPGDVLYSIEDEYNRTLPFHPDWQFEDEATLPLPSIQRRSWGVVVHADRLLETFGKELPDGMELSFFYNDSNSFRPADAGVDNYGNKLPLPQGETQDYGFRVSAFNNKLELRATWYETKQANTTISDPSGMVFWSKGAVARTISAMAQETWGSGPHYDQPTPEWLVNDWFLGEGNYDQGIAGQPIPADWQDQLSTLVNQPLRIRSGAVPGSPNYVAQGDINPDSNRPYISPPLTDDEIAYRTAWFNARSDEQWFGPLDRDWVAAKEFAKIEDDWRVWDENSPGGQQLLNDLRSEGMEIEITANPNERWRISFNASRNEATRTNILPDWAEFVEVFSPLWFDGWDNNPGGPSQLNYWLIDGYSDIRHWTGSQSYSSVSETFGGRIMQNVYAPYLNLLSGEGQGVNELRKWRYNFVTNYKFEEGGPLGAFNIGGAVRWQDKAAIGYYPKYNEEASSWVTDVNNPIYGPSEVNYDAWIGYERRLNDKYDYTVQLNIHNLFADDDMIPIMANPDGTIAQVRIPAKTTWTITNSIKF
ncbi:TonB-dependent receptor [Pelagicoccus mobilis]|uniref:TonB-dependent receptor n=1 Tax=Pelagicoccus mobilis TaxID=415221 RepID=A0A934S0U9_9BACT|nr:TonB-dependent receptor [Pelagicoccus mobilis]MBK1877812.1 TonB-dependent receptor [Pelagicoccus mobilis]